VTSDWLPNSMVYDSVTHRLESKQNLKQKNMDWQNVSHVCL